MSRFVKYIYILLMFVTASQYADARKSTNLRRERIQAEQKAKAAEKRLQENRTALRTNLNELNSVQADITRLDEQLKALRETSASLSNQIAPLTDSINYYTKRLDTMRDAYAKVLRRSYLSNCNLDELTFIFSSSSFIEAWRKLKTLKQFGKWRTRKSVEIKDITGLLDAKKQRLDSLSQENVRIISLTESSRKKLEVKRRETDELVRRLEASSAELEKEVARRNSEMAALDARIEEEIAEEARRIREEEEVRRKAEAERIEAQKREAEKREAEKRAAERADASKGSKSKDGVAEKKPAKSNAKDNPSESASKPTPTPEAPATTSVEKSVPLTREEQQRLTARFEAAKGKMSAPYKGSGKVVKKFGRQKHPRLANVTTENAGIDIETSRGAEVVAVFDGEVSKIFKLGGYNNVIVVRHGDYMTVYANLVDLKVAKGDKVSRGTELGRVYVDTSDSNRSVLHFELRHEKDKQDPELWLKKL
ncbi:MAG: peptidoglycan DD-metalloendopeptidase family protein [Muribaculaceae bacterium]|nr:peptidoglycan DD-metalloendopeptidase family protein [Muribaculaceae bacterium]